MSPINEPAIYISGLKIQEPITTLTDLIVSAICMYAFAVLIKKKRLTRTVEYMKWYFLLMGVATFLGGVIGHAFLYALSFAWKLPGWFISMIAVALIERSSIEYSRQFIKPAIGKVFLWVNLIELTTFMVITAITLNFTFVEIHSVYGLMVVVFSFHLYSYRKNKNPGSKLILFAIGLLFLAALVFNIPISLHRWFNHNDLAHVLMAIASILLFKSTLTLNQAKTAKDELKSE